MKYRDWRVCFSTRTLLRVENSHTHIDVSVRQKKAWILESEQGII